MGRAGPIQLIAFSIENDHQSTPEIWQGWKDLNLQMTLGQSQSRLPILLHPYNNTNSASSLHSQESFQLQPRMVGVLQRRVQRENMAGALPLSYKRVVLRAHRPTA
jgi:hypothetical protein